MSSAALAEEVILPFFGVYTKVWGGRGVVERRHAPAHRPSRLLAPARRAGKVDAMLALRAE